MTAARDNSVALSLGSSYLGYVTHAGFVAGLEERGIVPGHVAGSSAGALAAGLYAAGYRGDEARALLLDPRFRIKWLDWTMPLRFFPTVLHVPGQVGLLSGRNMRRHLRDLLSRKSPRGGGEEPPRLSVVVTNLTTGRSQWKADGDIAGWIVASCAVPGIFKQQRIGAQDYADGGIADPNPCAQWAPLESVETVILHRIAHPSTSSKRSWNLCGVIGRAHETITQELLDLQVRLLRNAGKRVVVAVTETPRPSILAGRRTGEQLWNLGRRTGLETADIVADGGAPAKKQSACGQKTR